MPVSLINVFSLTCSDFEAVFLAMVSKSNKNQRKKFNEKSSTKKDNSKRSTQKGQAKKKKNKVGK